jgi:hypothetical protein
MAARRLVLDGDFDVANGNDAEQQSVADAADRGPQRHEGEEHTSLPLSPSKLVVLKISTEAKPAPMPSAAPPSAPNAKPGKASNAIFIRSSCPETALWCVTADTMRFNGAGKENSSESFRGDA